MQPRPDQIDSFGFAYGWSDELQLGVAVLHIDYWGGERIELRMSLDRVLEFANKLAAAAQFHVEQHSAAITTGAVRPYATPAKPSEPNVGIPLPVTGFRFERIEDGLTIVFELHGIGLEARVVAESQQAQLMADYARAWYERSRESLPASLAGN